MSIGGSSSFDVDSVIVLKGGLGLALLGVLLRGLVVLGGRDDRELDDREFDILFRSRTSSVT